MIGVSKEHKSKLEETSISQILANLSIRIKRDSKGF